MSLDVCSPTCESNLLNSRMTYVCILVLPIPLLSPSSQTLFRFTNEIQSGKSVQQAKELLREKPLGSIVASSGVVQEIMSQNLTYTEEIVVERDLTFGSDSSRMVGSIFLCLFFPSPSSSFVSFLHLPCLKCFYLRTLLDPTKTAEATYQLYQRHFQWYGVEIKFVLFLFVPLHSVHY